MDGREINSTHGFFDFSDATKTQKRSSARRWQDRTSPRFHSSMQREEGRVEAVQCMTLWLSRATHPERVEHIFAVDHDDATADVLKRFRSVTQKDRGFSVGAWNLGASKAIG